MPRYDAPPKPRHIARELRDLSDKLADGGDTALVISKDQRFHVCKARQLTDERGEPIVDRRGRPKLVGCDCASGQSHLRSRRYDHRDRRPGPDNSEDDPGYNDQTGAVACSRAERGGSLYDRFVRDLKGLRISVSNVDRTYDAIMVRAKHAQAKRQVEEESRVAGSGHCKACGEWMPGGDEQRIKGGFCPTHAVGWHRAKERGETQSDYTARVRREKGLDSAV